MQYLVNYFPQTPTWKQLQVRSTGERRWPLYQVRWHRPSSIRCPTGRAQFQDEGWQVLGRHGPPPRPFPSAAGSPSGSGAARGPAPFLPREVTHCGKGTRWQSGVSRTAALSPDHETEGVVGHSTHTNKIKLTFRRLKPMPWREFKRHRQLFRSSRLTARCSIQS